MPRKQRREVPPNVITGVAWYRREEWDAWREACPDFEETYAEWESNAQDYIRTMNRQGMSVRKVVIGSEAFLAWCQQHGRSPDSDARSTYVAEVLQKQYDQPEP